MSECVGNFNLNSYFHLTTPKRFLFKFNIYLHENFILVFKIAAGATVHKCVAYKTFNIFCIYFLKLFFNWGKIASQCAFCHQNI